MKVRKVSGCDRTACPTVYISDRGTAVVQGEVVSAADGMTLAPGEQAVELPLSVLIDALPALAQVSGASDAVQRLRETISASHR